MITEQEHVTAAKRHAAAPGGKGIARRIGLRPLSNHDIIDTDRAALGADRVPLNGGDAFQEPVAGVCEVPPGGILGRRIDRQDGHDCAQRHGPVLPDIEAFGQGLGRIVEEKLVGPEHGKADPGEHHGQDKDVRAGEPEPYLERAAGETGAVMLVYNADGTILHQASAGPMAVSDPVYVASASKWVVAALLMTLVDDGLLELDAPASQYAPYLTAELSRITLRQMLSHTSGMNSSNLVDARANASLQTFARELAILALESAPGTTLSYGGVSMQIAGAIMEEVSGQSFQALFLDRLAGPLEMQGAYFCHPLNCDVENPEDVTNPLIGGGLVASQRVV